MKRLFYDKVVDDSNYYDDDIEDGREEDNESVDGDDEDYESDNDLASLPIINRGDDEWDSDSDSDSDDDDDDDGDKEEPRTTRSGRKVKTPERYKEMANLQLTQHEANYFGAMMTVSYMQTEDKEELVWVEDIRIRANCM
eukprot:scaffold2358_cov225-Chaetoceros_neogracile.AAC.1